MVVWAGPTSATAWRGITPTNPAEQVIAACRCGRHMIT
jgi:hypothetical protein